MIENKIDTCFSFNKLNNSCYCLDDKNNDLDCNKCNFYRDDINYDKIERDIQVYHYLGVHKSIKKAL